MLETATLQFYFVEYQINNCTKDSCDESAVCINVALGVQCVCPNGRRQQRDAASNKIKCVPEATPSDMCINYCMNGGNCSVNEGGITKCRSVCIR